MVRPKTTIFMPRSPRSCRGPCRPSRRHDERRDRGGADLEAADSRRVDRPRKAQSAALMTSQWLTSDDAVVRVTSRRAPRGRRTMRSCASSIVSPPGGRVDGARRGSRPPNRGSAASSSKRRPVQSPKSISFSASPTCTDSPSRSRDRLGGLARALERARVARPRSLLAARRSREPSRLRPPVSVQASRPACGRRGCRRPGRARRGGRDKGSSPPQWTPRGSSSPAMKRSGALARLVIGELLRRRLHEVARRPDQRAADAAVERELGAAHRVDDDAGGVRANPTPRASARRSAARRRRSCPPGGYRPTCGRSATARSRSGRHGRRSAASGTSSWLVTAWVFEIFFDSSRSRSSMFWKSVLPPKLSW